MSTFHPMIPLTINSLLLGLGAGCASLPVSDETSPHAGHARPHGAHHQTPTYAATTAPPIFINVDVTTDQTGRLPPHEVARLTNLVEDTVQQTGYATSWPGPLPTSAELRTRHSRAFAVASSVTQVDVMKRGARVHIACQVSVTISPWNGTDGDERWAAGSTAHASGTGNVTAGPSRAQLERAIQDCTRQLVEDLTSRQVLPFLRRVASAPI